MYNLVTSSETAEIVLYCINMIAMGAQDRNIKDWTSPFVVDIVSFDCNSTVISWDEHWPWYVTFHLIKKWGFPCCIYDPTLVEIHQIM